MQKYMKDNLRLILQDNLIRICLYVSISFIFIQTLLTVYFFPKLPPLIPFINSRPWGHERLASSSLIFLIPGFFVVIFLINNLMSAFFYKQNTLMARMLSITALLFILLGILAFLQIIFLVF